MIVVEIPGRETLEIAHVVFDVNGTLTDYGDLVAGVRERIELLRVRAHVHLASADTFGTLSDVAAALEVDAHRLPDAGSKLRLVESLGPAGTAHVGNGRNDVAALSGAALAIAVVGREGASGAALVAAHVVCFSVLDALDLLLEPRALAATLRG